MNSTRRPKAVLPDEWAIVGSFLSRGMAMRKNDSDFRQVVNVCLMGAIESGKYFELYDKWFGSKGKSPSVNTGDQAFSNGRTEVKFRVWGLVFEFPPDSVL
jgi:hypothetical protein